MTPIKRCFIKIWDGTGGLVSSGADVAVGGVSSKSWSEGVLARPPAPLFCRCLYSFPVSKNHRCHSSVGLNQGKPLQVLVKMTHFFGENHTRWFWQALGVPSLSQMRPGGLSQGKLSDNAAHFYIYWGFVCLVIPVHSNEKHQNVIAWSGVFWPQNVLELQGVFTPFSCAFALLRWRMAWKILLWGHAGANAKKTFSLLVVASSCCHLKFANLLRRTIPRIKFFQGILPT